ncbi:MAG: Hsp70 family protein [Myxococcota bacterium]
MTSSEIILGVDFGTTFSTAAAAINGKFQYALDERGEACIPSVVHFPRAGAPIVGAEADRLRATDPENTIHGIKRVIGRPIDSPQARVLNASALFHLDGKGGGEVKVKTRQGVLGASEVGSIILRYLKERAQLRFGRSIERAVVTVPVAATPQVHDAMVRMGRMAGLQVIRVIAEPVAGALARGAAGANDSGEPRLIFDFGGGTLDVTVVQRSGKSIKVLATAGDDCLGGDDFDFAFARWVNSKVFGSHGLDMTKDAILADAVQRQCEKVKRALSAANEARFYIPDALGTGGRKSPINLQVSRVDLRPEWAELVQRAVDVAREAISSSGLPANQLSVVSLIGGTAYVPQVREAVAHHLGRPLDVEIDPQTAVARGASLLAVFPQLIT